MVSNEETRGATSSSSPRCASEYEEIIKREVQVAIASDRDAIDRLCSKYIDNVKAYIDAREGGRCERSASAASPDERLMRSIEEKIDIPEARKDDFRHELMNYIAVGAPARGAPSTTARTSA